MTDAERLAALLAAPFYKMSGSGNDFVFFDARSVGVPGDVPGDRIAAICARGTGVGADGLVLLDQPGPDEVRIVYYNSDGTRASLCGNATLCTAALAVHLGAVPADAPFRIATDAGVLPARVVPGQGPAFELEPVRALTPDVAAARQGTGAAKERRIGYVVAGVPHVVVRVNDVDAVALMSRAPALRRPDAGRPEGANVNFVSPGPNGTWYMRTFERGVEGETLACGTGAVACAAVLAAWGEAGTEAALLTRSGKPLTVTRRPGTERPTLAGEGRLVYTGTLADLS